MAQAGYTFTFITIEQKKKIFNHPARVIVFCTDSYVRRMFERIKAQ